MRYHFPIVDTTRCENSAPFRHKAAILANPELSLLLFLLHLISALSRDMPPAVVITRCIILHGITYLCSAITNSSAAGIWTPGPWPLESRWWRGWGLTRAPLRTSGPRQTPNKTNSLSLEVAIGSTILRTRMLLFAKIYISAIEEELHKNGTAPLSPARIPGPGPPQNTKITPKRHYENAGGW